MTVPRLHAITDDARLAEARFLHDAVAVLEAGGPEVALHLRGRSTSAARLHELVLALRPVARAAGARLLLNDRVDVALASEADGAQLREDSMEPRDARRILGAAALLGASRHGATLDVASLEGADFVLWGSVFETTSHPGRGAAGLEALSTALESLGGAQPVIAIGGITPERVRDVLAAGAHGIAALSGIWRGAATAMTDYRAALGDAPSRSVRLTPDA